MIIFRILLFFFLTLITILNQLPDQKLASLLTLSPYRCPLKWITGLKCAFCGMTHAWIHLAKGRFTLATHENLFAIPLFLVTLLVLLYGSLYPIQNSLFAKRLTLFVFISLLIYTVFRNTLFG